MKTTYMLVTPQIAEEWLTHNTDNRNVRAKRVDQYARDMSNGRWEKDSPNPIVFGENGLLKDGQHRLMALIKANVSLNFLVCWVSDEVRNFDTGATRSVADYIKMKSGSNLSSTLIAAINLKLTMRFAKSPTRAEIEDEYYKDAATWDKAFGICGLGSKTKLGKRSSMVLAIKNALNCGVSEATLTRFCNVVNSGFSNGTHENSAILARNALLDMAGRMNSRKVQWELCGLLEEYIHLFENASTRVRKLQKPTWYYSSQLKEKEKWGTLI